LYNILTPVKGLHAKTVPLVFLSASNCASSKLPIAPRKSHLEVALRQVRRFLCAKRVASCHLDLVDVVTVALIFLLPDNSAAECTAVCESLVMQCTALGLWIYICNSGMF